MVFETSRAPSNFTQNDDCMIRLRYKSYPPDYGYYVCGPILATVIAIGLIGNGICLAVLLKIRPRPVVNFYTIPLCICDFAVLLSSFFMNNLPHLIYGRMKTYGPYVTLYPYLNFFSNFAYTCCVWMTILLAIERYFALCHSLKHRLYDAKLRSILIATGCVILSALYNTPRYFEIEVFQCFELYRRKTLSFMQPSEFRKLQSYWIIYKIFLGLLFSSLGPFILLCFLSIRMWTVVKRSQTLRKLVADAPNQNRILIKELSSATHLFHEPPSPAPFPPSRTPSGHSQRRSSDDRQGRVLMCTLLFVLLKFLIFHSVPAIIDLCELMMEQSLFFTTTMENLVDTSALLVVVNSSLNILIYVWCNESFRRTMKRMILEKIFEETFV